MVLTVILGSLCASFLNAANNALMREQLMLSEERKQAIKQEAASRARALDDKLLKAETQRLTLEEHDAPAGDARDELHLRCLAYVFEMDARSLKEK